MFFVQFIKDYPSAKPPIKKGQRAFLDKFRKDTFQSQGLITILKEINLRRSPFTEADQMKRITEGYENYLIRIKNADNIHTDMVKRYSEGRTVKTMDKIENEYFRMITNAEQEYLCTLEGVVERFKELFNLEIV